ncbi:NAD-dependent epimerase/dehydratase family protein [Williamsia sp. R60]
MRVLVTGVSGLVGRSTAERLAGAGHEVIGVSRSAPLEMPAGVTHVRGDIADDVLIARAVECVDVIVHAAFMLDAREGVEAMARTNVSGTKNLIRAAEAAGVRRAIFLSSTTVYGPRSGPDEPPRTEASGTSPHPDQPYAVQKVECERLFAESSMESVMVRAGIILGRGTDNRIQENLAAPIHFAASGAEYGWQIVHHDDVAAFLTLAVSSKETGVVNLGTDAIGQSYIAKVLGKKLAAVPPSVMIKAASVAGKQLHISAGEVACAQRMPIGDTTILRERWGFTPSWNARETVEDTRLAVVARTVRRGKVVSAGGRIPYSHQIVPGDIAPSDGAPLQFSGPDDVRGTFDTPIDPRFPVFSQTNLSEALPGPSTVLTLDVTGRALRGTTSAVARILALDGVLGTEAAARLQAIHAHRVFINASGSYHVALVMPGTNPDAMRGQFSGTHSDDLPGGEFAIVGTFRPEPVSAVTKAKRVATVGRRVLGVVRTVKQDVHEVRVQTDRLEKHLHLLESMSDERLRSVLLLARDLLGYAWTIQGVVNLASGAALEVASKNRGNELGNGDDLESSATLRGVRQLAAEAAADPEIVALLSDRSEGLADRVRNQAPDFWASVEAALKGFGHRGPAEAEFDARSFSDDIPMFLGTVGRAASTISNGPATAATGNATPRAKSTLAQRLAKHLLSQREQNRDRCVRLTWITRRLVREQGRRLVAQGRIDHADDLFALTLPELLDPADTVRATIADRQAERVRLAALHMPPVFAGTWEVADVLPPLQPGDSLRGIGICGGTVRGRARVINHDTIDDLEPDEIMIAHVTDVGYTALFAHAAAVVTDIGGVMSHAAVVAREYGVPCIVDTQVAAARVQNGALVEIDGKSGTLTVLEAAQTHGHELIS